MLLQSSGRIDAECEVVATGLGHAEWQEVDRRLPEYARRRSTLDAVEAFDFVRAEQLKIYVSFGFVSLYEYLERVLGYKPHTARERMRVARALAALPETTAALARGALSYSAVRELTRVATAETEADWLAQAEGLAALHACLLIMRGQAPYLIEFRWVYGPPIPVGLDPAARKVVIEQRVQEISQASDAMLRNEPSLTSESTGRHRTSQLGRRAKRKAHVVLFLGSTSGLDPRQRGNSNY